jgi:hypothetical protein
MQYNVTFHREYGRSIRDNEGSLKTSSHSMNNLLPIWLFSTFDDGKDILDRCHRIVPLQIPQQGVNPRTQGDQP